MFDVTFGSSEIREQDVNTDSDFPFSFYADKSAPLQWNVIKKKDLSDYLTPVSQLVSSGLQWKRNEVTITSSILIYGSLVSGPPFLDGILTYNVEVSHQQYSHLSDKFILVIYPEATANAYNNWKTMNQDSNQIPILTWTEVLPRVYGMLETNNTDPEPPALECALWLIPMNKVNHYHPGMAHEMRTEALVSGTGQGHQATYDGGGALITSGLGAGTADRVAPIDAGSRVSHLSKDVKPFVRAAQLDGNPVMGTAFFRNLTHPLMHKGANLVKYLELRPIRASEPLDRGMCPPEETEETTE